MHSEAEGETMRETAAAFSLRDAFHVFIRHPSPFILLFITGSFWVFRLTHQAEWTNTDTFLAAGVVLYWPFQEWWMHRWLLHLKPIQIGSKTIELDFAEKHRLHHENPTDIPLIFLPIQTIFASLLFFSGIVYALSGSFVTVATFMGAASFSTLLYEWTHYLTHTQYKPASSFYRQIWKQHRWHHYKNEAYWFSFTIPYIDGWMGTGPPVKSVPNSDTARTLGRRPDGESPSGS
jgi:hypothetical protein